MKTVLLEMLGFGGQLLTYEKVENYPGFPEGIGAYGLGELISAQALKFGLKTQNAEVRGLGLGEAVKTVETDRETLRTRTIIIASGASPNKLGVSGEAEYTGRGVSYCAVCDAPFYRNQEVAVVGGGDTAIEEAIYLTKFASRVYVIHRRDQLRATSVIREKAAQNEKISLVLDTVVTDVRGDDGGVNRLALRGTKNGKISELPVNGVFMFVGMKPNSGFVRSPIDVDPLGFIRTDQEMETSVPGVFAAGDIRAKQLRQIATAVGDGATAAFNAERHILNNFSDTQVP
jgi:thioredoxin reductase (NADPH)